MTIIDQKPSYWVTVRDCLIDFLKAENGPARMYEPDVFRAPVIKSIGLNPSAAESDIYASGIVYDHIRRVQGAEISLGAVALDHELVDKALGAIVDADGYVYDKTNNVSCEFAFGYFIEKKDGNYVYYWHPRCLLTQADDAVETATDSAPDPNRSFTIKAMPTSEGIWRVRYDTSGKQTPLTPEQFFAFVRYTDKAQAASVSLPETVKVGTAASATLTYANGASPTSPTVAYSWWIAETADGAYEQIEGAATASYTPVAGDEGSYIKCVALISGSAVGYVESAPKQVAAA